jgi:hypothetical protein
MLQASSLKGSVLIQWYVYSGQSTAGFVVGSPLVADICLRRSDVGTTALMNDFMTQWYAQSMLCSSLHQVDCVKAQLRLWWSSNITGHPRAAFPDRNAGNSAGSRGTGTGAVELEALATE